MLNVRDEKEFIKLVNQYDATLGEGSTYEVSYHLCMAVGLKYFA